jgi:hypothetical protein
MKIKLFLFFVIVTSTCCFAQLKVSAGGQIYISNAENLYSASDIINEGTITLGTGKLFVAGNIDNNGTLTLNDGTLNVTGNSATQTFDLGTSVIVKRIELDKTEGTATVNSGNLIISDGLLANQGTIDGGGKLIMRSTANKTAIVEQSTGGTVNNIVVERYIPSKRAFRFLSSFFLWRK